jgi:hypothetical protein
MNRWRLAQLLALLAILLLLATLFVAPRLGLTALWDVAVPVLPAVFLIQPGIWRNICPLATLSMLPNRPGGRILDNGRIPLAGGIGIALLALMVPARRFLFNTDGPILALTIIPVAALAMTLGAIFDKKAGFCSGICPVLPVERLYGQHPLLAVSNPRCAPCTMCTTRGCLDIAHSKSIAQTLGRERKSHAWLQTPFGAFAAAFPGFVLGYNLTPDSDLASAGAVYLTVAVTSALSYGVVQLLVRATRLSSASAFRILGALAFGLYYWFAASTVSHHLHLPALAPAVVRGAAFLLLLAWLWKSSGTPGRRLAPS